MISLEAKEILGKMRRAYGSDVDLVFTPDYFNVLDGGFVNDLVQTETVTDWEAGLARISECINHKLIIRTDKKKLVKVLVEQFKRWSHVLEGKGWTGVGIAEALNVQESEWNTVWRLPEINERIVGTATKDPNSTDRYYQKMLLVVEKLMASEKPDDQLEGMKMCLKLFKDMGRPDEQGKKPSIGDLGDDSSLPATGGEMPRVNIMSVQGWRNKENISRIVDVKVNGEVVTLQADDAGIDEDGRNVSA